jgi:pyruvate dehydrogenase E2 component (dihydrolipoamide acetyltransferase)
MGAGPIVREQETLATSLTTLESVQRRVLWLALSIIQHANAVRKGIPATTRRCSRTTSGNDLIVKASALALRRHPRANASYQDGNLVSHVSVNVGFGVAADDVLLVPVIAGVDVKSVGQIASESRALADRVRDATITAAELAGGTFTVSNLGMFGMTAITPVINPPEAAILGVGSIRETLARREGEIQSKQVLTLTLSCDHRILYGAHAARFLAEIRDLLETPHALLL